MYSTKKKKLPNLYDGGKTLFLTIAYPPNPSAAAVVHRLLLDQFNPESFVVLTGYFLGAKKTEAPNYVNIHFIYLSLEFLSSKLHRLIAKIQRITIPIFLSFYFKKYKPKRIIIAYPDLYWLEICLRWTNKYPIPFIAYLHDTILEGSYLSHSKETANKTQVQVFNHAYKIAVMSEGMRSLYAEKYRIQTTAWEHIYPEDTLPSKGERIKRAHWSGDIYSINNKAVQRLSLAIKSTGKKLTISNGKTREQLYSQGIQGNHIEKIFYPQRADYLDHLNTSAVVLLGLNFPDECQVHEDELSTIFSTKTPEYLASNALIIYHGPKHYFLAQFIIHNKCGLVVSKRNIDDLAIILADAFNYPQKYRSYIDNAKNALSKFKPEYVGEKVIQTLL